MFRYVGPNHSKKTIRELSKIDIEAFKEDLIEQMPDSSDIDSLDDAVEKYESVLTSILDAHAPQKEISYCPGKSDWWNDVCQEARRKRRASERVWKKHKDKPDAEEYRELYREACVDATIIITRERDKYYERRLTDAKGDSKATYSIVNNLLDKDSTQKAPTGVNNKQVAETLKTFFKDKVQKIYSSIEEEQSYNTNTLSESDSPLSSNSSNKSASAFTLFTFDDVSRIIKEMQNKSCELDPIPTWLLKNCLPQLLPSITLMVNLSLQDGYFPQHLKSAIVRPIFKGATLDSDDTKNYRPISNLSFLSKVIEKCVHHDQHIVSYINDNKLFSKYQSGYRKNMSCETVQQ